MICNRRGLIASVGTLVLICALLSYGQDPEKFTDEQMRDFLLKAEIISERPAPKGVTGTARLTLKYGTITHEASFQSIDEKNHNKVFDNGTKEPNFHDSYKYNTAAYELAKLLGLGDMMPVTVEREYKRNPGSLSWWLTSMMDETKRQAKHIDPPDPEAWYKQTRKMTVFGKLVYDTDRNAGNVLITKDWHLYMIDFSRAFRLYPTLKDPKVLTRCDRQLLQKLRQLDAAEVKQKMGEWLNKEEIKALMARRDKIVALFDGLIAKKGENEVLYDSAASGN